MTELTPNFKKKTPRRLVARGAFLLPGRGLEGVSAGQVEAAAHWVSVAWVETNLVAGRVTQRQRRLTVKQVLDAGAQLRLLGHCPLALPVERQVRRDVQADLLVLV